MIEITELKTLSPPFLYCPRLLIQPGDVIRVEGSSGCGKSSFLKALVGLRSVSVGHFLIDKLDLKRDFLSLRKNILYLPQESLQGDMSVISLYSKITYSRGETFTFKNSLLARLQMLDILNKKLDDLSGGQKQILTLNMALELNPKVLLLDETFNGIDANKIEVIFAFLKEYLKKNALMYVSHHQSRLDSFANARVLITPKEDYAEIKYETI